MSRRVQMLFLTLIGGTALLASIFVATGVLGTGGTSFTATSRKVSGATASGQAEPGRVQDSVASWTKKYGEPGGTDFARLRIPSINVDAPVGSWSVSGNAMPEPWGPTDVAWYDLSAFPGHGGYPGTGKNAIFGAHADLNREFDSVGARYIGPAVFWDLDQLGAGDRIDVVISGTTLKYSVVWSEEVGAHGTDWAQYWSNNVKVDSITLFTCSGKFDPDTHEYASRLIVRAERIK